MLLIRCVLMASAAAGADPDLVIHHGKIVTVDPKFSIAQAMSVKDGRVVAVGSN